MTIESNISKNTFAGNGQTTIFPFTYKIWKTDEIKVTIEDEKGITSSIMPFAVTINKNGGGEVVLYLDDENKTPIPTGYTIALTRNMPFLQEQDYLNGGRFNAEVIEDNFDIACAERQQLKEVIERTIQIPPTSGIKPEKLLNEIFNAKDTAVEQAGVATVKAQISTEQAALSGSYAQSASEQAVLSQEYASTAKAWAESDTPPDPTDENSKSAKTWNAVVTENAENQITEINKAGLDHVEQARKWAESETSPDPDDPYAKSAKTWALSASENIPLATYEIAGKVKVDEEAFTVSPEDGLLQLKDTGVEKGEYGLSENISPDFGEAFEVPNFEVNEKGNLVTAGTKSVTLPIPSITDIPGNAGTADALQTERTFTIPASVLQAKSNATVIFNGTGDATFSCAGTCTSCAGNCASSCHTSCTGSCNNNCSGWCLNACSSCVGGCSGSGCTGR